MSIQLLSKLIVGIAENKKVKQQICQSPATQNLVTRFIAGETLDQATHTVSSLNSKGLKATLDYLGENTTSQEEATLFAEEACAILQRIAAEALDANISIKLTQLGLDLGEYVVVDAVQRILRIAEVTHNFVRIDMEGSTYTGRTVELFSHFHKTSKNIGIVLQSCLYRTMSDAQALTREGARIRLVKGAYREPPHIAYRRKRDTDRSYVRIMEYLLHEGHTPAIATHDEAIIQHACHYAQMHGISPKHFEFQMLYGIRRDLQESLAAQGYTVRIYVPYGTQWYPYLVRRIAERPANLQFVLKHIIRE